MRGLPPLPPAGRGRLASAAPATRPSRVGGRFRKARRDAPSPGFLRSAALRSEPDLSPLGRGGASGSRVPEPITRKSYQSYVLSAGPIRGNGGGWDAAFRS